MQKAKIKRFLNERIGNFYLIKNIFDIFFSAAMMADQNPHETLKMYYFFKIVKSQKL